MNTAKAIYNNGKIEFIDIPTVKGRMEILIVFPEFKKEMPSLRGILKNSVINTKNIKKQLEKLNVDIEKNILEELSENE